MFFFEFFFKFNVLNKLRFMQIYPVWNFIFVVTMQLHWLFPTNIEDSVAPSITYITKGKSTNDFTSRSNISGGCRVYGIVQNNQMVSYHVMYK